MITNYKKYNPELRIVEKLPGRILTQPSEPSATNSSDNNDGNLICRVHDIIHSDIHQYTVLDLLGTGTFGQVFRCQIAGSGELVAVKVVKGKPAYRTQGLLEVKIAKLLNTLGDPEDKKHIVRIIDSFEYKGHICIVFELLGCSLLDLLTQNQFRGLPLHTVQKYTKQILMSLVVLQDASVIHCDLKPENILLINKRSEKKKEKIQTSPTTSLLSSQLRQSNEAPSANIGDLKLIDFGSACFEGKTMYSYIQSRFYRSPEVLLGVPYNGSIDMWSLGCVCAEMFVGLPIFPGVSQHNQLCRIVEMLGPIPDFLIRQGKNGPKFFTQENSTQYAYSGYSGSRQMHSIFGVGNSMHDTSYGRHSPTQRQMKSSFRLKTAEEFAYENHVPVPTFKKYLKYDHLDDIILRCPSSKKSKLTPEQKNEEIVKRKYFLDFLRGLFNLNPFERWTAKQALNHPFICDFERIGLQRENLTTMPSSQSQLTRTDNLSMAAQQFPSDEVFSVTIPIRENNRDSFQNSHSGTDEIIVTMSPPENKILLARSPSPLLPYTPPEDPIQHARYQHFQQKLLGTSTSHSIPKDENVGKEFRLLKKGDRRESEPIGLNRTSAIPVPAPPISHALSEQMASSIPAPSGASFFWPLFAQQPSTSSVLSPQSQTQAQQLSPDKQGTQDQKRRSHEGPTNNLTGEYHLGHNSQIYSQRPHGYSGNTQLSHYSNRSQLSYSYTNQGPSLRDSLQNVETGGIPIPNYHQNSQSGRTYSSAYHQPSSYGSGYPSSLGGLGNMSGVATDFGHALNRAELDESRYLQSFAHQQSPQSYSPRSSPLNFSPGGLLGSQLSSSPTMGNVMPSQRGSFSNSRMSPQQRDDRRLSYGSYDSHHSDAGSPSSSPTAFNSGIASRGYEQSHQHQYQRRPSDASKYDLPPSHPQNNLHYEMNFHGSVQGHHRGNNDIESGRHGSHQNYQAQNYGYNNSPSRSQARVPQYDYSTGHSSSPTRFVATDNELESNYRSIGNISSNSHQPVSALTAALAQSSFLPNHPSYPPQPSQHPNHPHPPPHHGDRQKNGK